MGEIQELQEWQVLGACAWCGDEEVPVWENNHLCDECDETAVHCSICDEDQHEDDTCRHVFRDQCFVWSGSGYEDEPNESVRASFVALVSKMPRGFAEALRDAIIRDKFYSFLIAPLIGIGGILDLNGVRVPDGEGFNYWGDAMVEIGESEDAEETADGYGWLASLYKGKTLAANQATVDILSQMMREDARRG